MTFNGYKHTKCSRKLHSSRIYVKLAGNRHAHVQICCNGLAPNWTIKVKNLIYVLKSGTVVTGPI